LPKKGANEMNGIILGNERDKNLMQMGKETISTRALVLTEWKE
jgi:hypothetical protein